MTTADAKGVPVSVSLPRYWAGISDFFGDKRFVAGTLLGLALLAGGYAVSADNNGAGGSPGDPLSQLLSDQESVITAQMKLDAQECAKGTQEGTLGYAINMSLKAHLELASASPNVEQLFDVNADCFSGLSSLIDLSFAIPSLASILSAAQNAVMAYAKKKICSAVSKVTGMVTGPINQAIGTANGYIGSLNGMSANLNSGGGLLTLDPNLGASYNVGMSGEYTTGQPFTGTQQTDPGNSTGNGDQGAGNYTQVQQLTQQLGQLQSSIIPAVNAQTQAQTAYNSCIQVTGNTCTNQQTALQAANQNVSNIQNQITSVQNQINGLLSSGGNSTGNTSTGGGTAVFGGTATGKSAPQQDEPLAKKLTNLFQ